MLFRVLVALLWCLSWLPFRVTAALGEVLGRVLHALPTSRRRIGRINLRLCFPQLDEPAREALLRRHFVAMAQMLLEYGYNWFASPARLKRMVHIEGLPNLLALDGKPVILMMPHFTGLDLAGLRLSLETPVVSIYAKQKDPWLDAFFRAKRLRLNTGQIFPRQAGVRPTLKALRQGFRLYYLPDQDYGRRESVFVNFFGIKAATITGLSRLAGAAQAQVLPCYPRRERDGYVLVIEPVLQDFPSGDVTADAARMNAVIERQALSLPHQYFWLHKRFKTRPEGEADLYGR